MPGNSDKERLRVIETNIEDLEEDVGEIKKWRETATRDLTMHEGLVSDYKVFKGNISADVAALEKRTMNVENDRKKYNQPHMVCSEDPARVRPVCGLGDSVNHYMVSSWIRF